jgi:hypothetical protein
MTYTAFRVDEIGGRPIVVVEAVFPEEIYAAPKTWAEKAYSNMIYYNKFPKGTHFAAWGQPEYFVGAQREGFRILRS